MKETNAKGVCYYSVPAWGTQSTVAHGLFTRTGGVSPPPYASLNVGPKGGDTLAHVRENLKRAARVLSIPAERIFCAAQVHGDRIHQVSGGEPSIFGPDAPLQGDGLVTVEKGLKGADMVRALRESSSAICLLLKPFVTSFRISSSRCVRVSDRPCFLSLPEGEAK